MQHIVSYFPDITQEQLQRFAALEDLYGAWNQKINLISRKDIQYLYLHHVLHSLAIAKILRFTPGSQVVDIGTGGGFPGIPLAILMPDVQFHLIDSIGKKVRAAEAIGQSLSLTNVRFSQLRMEEEKGKYDFAVSRAAMPLDDLVRICSKNIAKQQRNALPNGLICLKGGDLEAETAPFKRKAEMIALNMYFHEAYFQTKKAVYLPL